MPSTLLPHHNLLFDLIQARLALTLDEHRRLDTVRIVDEMIASREINDLQDLVRRLSDKATTEPIWQKFVRIATIGETYFFRDLNQLNALRYSVLPRLIEQRRNEGRLQLRLWSAGCSTGEEPYTLAIILRELIPDYASWDLSILATDLNMTNLERARTGVYRAWSFRSETPEHMRQRWFNEEDGAYRINASIRSMVTFAPLNLVNDPYPSYTNGTTEMDVILCRNVLIYFDNPTAAAVITGFQNTLRHDGWLILGHAESAHVINQYFEPRNFENAVLYQRSTHPAFDTFSALSLFETQSVPVPVQTTPAPTLPRTASRQRPTTPSLAKKKTTGILANPSSAPDPFQQAQQAADKEEWMEALRWLTEAEKKYRLRAEVHYLRGIVEQQMQELDKSLSSLRRALYCDSNFVLAHLAIGDIYEKQGQFKRAHYEWNQGKVVLGRLPADTTIAFGDDLTAETLAGLIQYRLDNLSAKKLG